MDKPSGYKKKKDQYMINVVASNIRRKRNELGISIDRLAVLCDIEPKIISNYELGKVEMNLTNICIISRELGLKPNELLIEAV